MELPPDPAAALRARAEALLAEPDREYMTWRELLSWANGAQAIVRDLLAALAQAAQERDEALDKVQRVEEMRAAWRHDATVEMEARQAAEAQLAAVTAELQMGHTRLDESTRVRDVKGTLYERISKFIEQLVWEKSEIECLLNATGLEKDAMQASLGAAEHRRAAAEYRATRIELDKELLARAEKAETALRTLQRAQEGLTVMKDTEPKVSR